MGSRPIGKDISVPAITPDGAGSLPTSQTEPLVSIGVPLYNAEKYLRVALDSMLAQTFRDIEIVISDNGSTDATLDICREYQARDPRVRYVHVDVNRGLVWNHLRVQDLARGRYFMFGPQDDWMAPEYVERCVAALDADPGLAYVYSEALVMDEDGTLLGREITRQRVTDPSPSKRFWDVLIVKGGVNFYGMTRLELRKRIGRWKPVPRGERIVLAELALWGRFQLIPGDLYFRRVHANQFTTNRRSRRVEARVLDPSRQGWRSTVPVLLAEYVLRLCAGGHARTAQPSRAGSRPHRGSSLGGVTRSRPAASRSQGAQGRDRHGRARSGPSRGPR